MITLSQLRRNVYDTMKANLPAKVVSVVEFLYPPQFLATRLKQQWRRKRYLRQSAGLDASSVLLAGSHPVRVTDEAKETYEEFCWRDERMVIEIENFLKLTKDKQCLYDVGSLHGVFSFSFARATGGRSFAFEPSSLASRVLQEVGALNPDLKVELQPVALGQNPGHLWMRLEWQHLVAVPEAEATVDCQRIEVKSLEAFAATHAAPDCIKVDVEGFEYEVLKGAAGVLKSTRPLLFVEVHPVQLLENGVTVAELVQYIRSFDYTIFDAQLRPWTNAPSRKTDSNIFNLICR